MPDYAGVMASLATDALGSRPRGERRVLMLGLGGGTIAADIMLVHAPLRGTGPGPSREEAYRSGPPLEPRARSPAPRPTRPQAEPIDWTLRVTCVEVTYP